MVCKVPGTSLSPGRLKWALVAQRIELRAQSERPSGGWCIYGLCPALHIVKKSPAGNKGQIGSFGHKKRGSTKFLAVIFALLETYKLPCYCRDVMCPAGVEH